MQNISSNDSTCKIPIHISQNVQIESSDNLLVVGAPKQESAEKILIPNLLSGTGSYLVIDPDGIIRNKTKGTMEKMGYKAYSCCIDNLIISFYDYFLDEYHNIFQENKIVLYVEGGEQIKKNRVISDITLIIEDFLNNDLVLDPEQHLAVMINDFGNLAGGVNFPYTLDKIKESQISAILCTESLLALAEKHYNPMLTDVILNSCKLKLFIKDFDNYTLSYLNHAVAEIENTEDPIMSITDYRNPDFVMNCHVRKKNLTGFLKSMAKDDFLLMEEEYTYILDNVHNRLYYGLYQKNKREKLKKPGMFSVGLNQK